MIRFAALFCAVAFPVVAQDWTSYTPAEQDDLEIRESSEGHFAEIAYVNDVSQISTGGTHVLVWEGVEIEVFIEITPGPELITITPPDGFMAIPDYAEVPDDGVPFVFQVAIAMF